MKRTGKIIQSITQQLQPAYPDAQLAQQYAWWLLQALLNMSATELRITHELELTPTQQKTIDQWIHQLVNEHKPLAYILGTVPFGPLELHVQPPILIPRMETEEWVLNLITQLQKQHIKPRFIADLCTGSGCIALLLAHSFPEAQIIGSDINPQAVALAKHNKQITGIANVTFVASDLFANYDHETKFDLIVSNPPYITADEYATLDRSVTDWEDKQALYADNNGLAIIEQIIIQAAQYINTDSTLAQAGLPQLYLEIGWLQGDAVAKLMRTHGWSNVQLLTDAAGNGRVVCGCVP
jgi:release factor glutamine methyltransferase